MFSASGRVGDMKHWLCVQCRCGRRRIGSPKMIAPLAYGPREPLVNVIARMRCDHCRRTKPEAFLAFERDAKNWIKRP
jgi:hypothetical protein